MPQLNKLGRAFTSQITDNQGRRVILYRGTPVVTWDDNFVTLDTRSKQFPGGLRSFTNKVRMNQAANQFALGLSVKQKAGEWFVVSKGGVYRYEDGLIVRQVDGAVFVIVDGAAVEVQPVIEQSTSPNQLTRSRK